MRLPQVVEQLPLLVKIGYANASALYSGRPVVTSHDVDQDVDDRGRNQ